MIARVSIGFVAAATLAGCLPSNSAPAPRPLKPEAGPAGSVHVDYFGGNFSRQIQTRFRVERSAYVLVGHLGGDGQVRVLYPKTPGSSGWVSGNKTVSLKPYTAMYDMSPHLFSFATAPYRNFGAQMDSYDGLGHGYVFMIASRYPIDVGALMDARGFEELEIEDYEDLRDPRYAVRSFADDISTGPYTLKFASSLHGNQFARATGCPSRWGLMSYRTYDYLSYLSWPDLGYSYFTYPGSSLLSGFALAHFYGYGGYGQRSCRGTHYAGLPRFYRTHVTATVPTGTPTGPLTPRLQRPERRTLTDPERTAIIGGRSAIDRGHVTSTRRSASGSHRTVERASRPMDTPRMTTPSAPPTTTSSSSSSGGETKAERPRPQP